MMMMMMSRDVTSNVRVSGVVGRFRGLRFGRTVEHRAVDS